MRLTQRSPHLNCVWRWPEHGFGSPYHDGCLFDRKRVAGGEPQADNLIMQRYCPVCHKLIDMRRLSDPTRPSDVADPWHFERHAREDYSGDTATRRICPGSGKNEHDARDSW